MDRRIKRFNKSAGAEKSKPAEILSKLDIRQGQTIVEIGVGGGYYIEKFAEAVGESGKVYGVDIDMFFLDNLKCLNNKYKQKVVYPIVGDKEFFRMIPNNVNLIFSRNTYHHLSERKEYFEKLREKLAMDGKLVIIEHNRKSLIGFLGHSTRKDVIIKEISQAGYKLLNDYNILKVQSFLVFGK